MVYPEIQHHGARDGVTGSCHQLVMNASASLLVDCGLFQGDDASIPSGESGSRLPIDFPLDTIKALVVTHVHIDHVGRIPYLLAAGFEGPILCSEASAKLLPIVLEDAFKLSFSRDQQRVERYIDMVESRLVALPYQRWFTVVDTEELIARVRLQRAGHILGSAYAEVDLHYPQQKQSKRVVFSGDLGAPHAPFLMPPQPPERADILVLESTYGDRLHEDRQTRRQRLEAVIEHALQDQGTVLIPAFSVGRTQELLYELEDIIHTKLNPPPAPVGASSLANTASSENPNLPSEESVNPAQLPLPSGERAGVRGSETKLQNEITPESARGRETETNPQPAPETNWPQLPIILDSPLASRFTEAYRALKPFWNQEARERVQAGRRPLAFEQLLTIDSHADHQRIVDYLTQTARPAIVIAGGGMCSGGRIVNYLKAMLGDKRHNVLFVGHQAKGTPGHAIQTYGPKGGYVDLDGKRIDIRAGVTSIGGYSAHADQKGLVEFVTGMQRWPTEIRVVHGEEKAKQALAAQLQSRYKEQGSLGLKVIAGARE
ncbi:MBL fold metallo-hydrolase RNA specificity domain-containing protein [Pseudomonas saudiphocaensis]|uniref:Beta-lactamase domain-containing protein n=1 Tax=Pseudomonas saudiphocaensis TaxID=1499686 RepID=A0A078LXJ6_9PSED|nr:MBL fold metallo-hydrolase [Pseudomonas saudiphocaensis]CDZ94631.1 beta-lactamase domain-containing protein [Pseudomonas saudiphocaensis]